MLSALSSSLSALRAFGRKVGVTAHNVANVNTDGFKPQSARLEEQTPGGVVARVTTPPKSSDVGNGQPDLSAVELPTEMANLIVAKRSYEANIKVAQVASETEDAVLDLIG